MAENDGRPVLTGLIALVSVGLVVGLIAGGAALAGTQVLGFGGDSGGTGTETASDGSSMYLPPPEPSEAPTGPRITLGPGEEASTPAAPPSATPKDEIELKAAAAQVAPGQNIDLNGSYAKGEGAILQVQRFQDGAWVDFNATVGVNNGGFSTYIYTGQTGEQRFRVTDKEANLSSNEIVVTIG